MIHQYATTQEASGTRPGVGRTSTRCPALSFDLTPRIRNWKGLTFGIQPEAYEAKSDVGFTALRDANPPAEGFSQAARPAGRPCGLRPPAWGGGCYLSAVPGVPLMDSW